MKINPLQVHGAWRLGWTLDFHTTSSEFTGYDQHGHAQFDTTRSQLGELLYLLKYRGQNTTDEVAAVVADFFVDKPVALGRIDLVVPVPPSTSRNLQPVAEIAKAVATKLGKIFVVDAVRKVRETPGLKSIRDPEERRELLDSTFEAQRKDVSGKNVLLIDDLYRSGATANAVSLALLAAGASRVYFLAVTRTRSNI